MQRSVAARTLGYLHDRSALYGVCDACQHVSTLDIPALTLRFGAAENFAQLRRRLRCTACGSRHTHLMHG
jgi:hypothetical protein